MVLMVALMQKKKMDFSKEIQKFVKFTLQW